MPENKALLNSLLYLVIIGLILFLIYYAAGLILSGTILTIVAIILVILFIIAAVNRLGII